MANRITNGSGRKLDAPAIARQWLELGIRTVPIRPGQKVPSGGEGWNKLRITAETIKDYFKPGDNVGALWGEPSGWVIDVDLDWDEAARIAPYWLPDTFVYGRESRPGTHYLIKSEGCKGAKRVNPLGRDAIIELRSTLTQSVLPGSIHPDGERYEINEDRKILSLSAGALAVRCSRIAGLALLARAYPEGGGRHDFVHAVAGALLRDGWPDAEVRIALRSLIEGAGDKESDAGQRNRTVENTIKQAKAGGNTYGWPTLAQYISEKKVLEQIKAWLREGRSPTITITTGPRQLPRVEYVLPPKLSVPGLVGDIAAWSNGRSYILQPVFDLAVGLAATALLTMNRYEVAGRTALQPYFLLTAPTAGGKDNALSSVYQFARRLNLGAQCFQGWQSWHAMVDTLAAPPHMACMLWDEVPRKLKGSDRGQDFQILTWLLSLYGKANSSTPGMPARGQAIPPIEFPFLTVLGTAQPSALIQAITERDLDTGLINRFTLFDAGDGLAPENERVSDVFPTKLELAAKRLRDKPLPTGDRPFELINMGTTVANRFKEFSHYSRERSCATGVGEMWGRANQNALIMAGIVAAGCSINRPVITEEIADWAIEFAKWSFGRWETRLDRQAARSRDEADSQRVETVIRKAKELAKNPRWRPTQAALLRRGRMPRAVLYQNTRFLRGSKALEEKLEYLIGAGIIGRDEDEDSYYAL